MPNRTPAGETPPPMPDYTTRGETAEGAIRNAALIAETHLHSLTCAACHGQPNGADTIDAFRAVARLLRQALLKLQENR